MDQGSNIIFVCEHGAAKSILASAYFNKLSREKGLNLISITRGTNPDEVLSPKTIQGLQRDGLEATESIPQKLLVEEADSAQKIIAFCELPEEFQKAAEIEVWENVPPVSENYEIARAVIVDHLNRLLNEMSKIS